MTENIVDTFIDEEEYEEPVQLQYYKIADGRIWEIATEQWVEESTVSDSRAVVELRGRDVDYLYRTLQFYKYGTGSLKYEALSTEDLKANLLAELEEKAAALEENLNKEMYFTSSLGFKCNGDRRTRSNISDLITYFSGSDTVDYRDYENNTQQLTKEQLTVLLQEHVINGNALYQQKWTIEAQINAAEDNEALKAINIEFTMSDFSASE